MTGAIGICYRCRYAESTEPGWLICARQGRVNDTFARQYHDCYEPRTVEPGDYD